MNAPLTKNESVTANPRYTLAQLTRYALRLGTIGFGGPVALVGYMHRDLVEERQWISEAEYKEGLALAQLMPGPLAAQLAMYLGYVHYGITGAGVVGLAFVLPSFLMVVALGEAYLRYGGIPWMQAVLYGVGAAVIGIIALSAYKLTRKTNGTDRLLWTIGIISGLTTIAFETEPVALFLASGIVVWFIRCSRQLPRDSVASFAAPLTLAVQSIPPWTEDRLVQIAFFFTKAGAFVFGSGLAIVPFLYSGVVKDYGWLNDQEFLDAMAVAMITPGPVVITVGFIGYLVTGRDGGSLNGFLGASVASIATFLPCYLFTILPAPYFKRHGKRPGIVAFVDGITAAAVGAIAGACVVLGRRTIITSHGEIHFVKIIIMVLTLLALLRFKKITEPMIVVVAAALGLLLSHFGVR